MKGNSYYGATIYDKGAEMGQRGEIYSTRVFIDEGNKTFFFNVKENRFHDTYLNIVESRKTDSGFKRSSIVVFAEDMEKFLAVLNKCTAQLREKKNPIQADLSVGGGRRLYEFKTPPRGKPALQIIETRDDATGKRRESVMVPLLSMPEFLEGLEKAASRT